jgi:spore germination protein GerM
MRRLAPLVGALALVSALSGCSVATQNTATPLPSSLTLGAAPTTTTTVPTSQAAHQLEAYFLKGGKLYAVDEPYSTDPLGAALEALDIGPTAEEANRGITTAFSASPAQITSAGVKDGVALIKVDDEFTSLPGEALEEAFAQIVFTVIGLPNGPISVQFLYDGYHLDALAPPGQLLSRPVTRSDFCAFAPTSYIPCQKVTGTVGIT